MMRGWVFIPAVSEAVAAVAEEDWRLYEWETDGDGNIVRDSTETPCRFWTATASRW